MLLDIEQPLFAKIDFSHNAAKECVMLVLTRKLKESIRIGDNITITVLRVKGNTVRIGIEAPRDVRVVRGELAPLGEPTATSAQGGGSAAGELIVGEFETGPAGRGDGTGWKEEAPADGIDAVW